MIRKWWEVVCDVCGQAEHFGGSRGSAIEQAKECGWIIKGRNTVYCSYECKQKKDEKERSDE